MREKGMQDAVGYMHHAEGVKKQAYTAKMNWSSRGVLGCRSGMSDRMAFGAREMVMHKWCM